MTYFGLHTKVSTNQGISKTRRKACFPDPRVPVLESLLPWNFQPECTSSRGLSIFGYISDQRSLLGMLSAPMAAFSFMQDGLYQETSAAEF